MATEKQHAMFLADPKTGAVTLFHADDVAKKMEAGFAQPEGHKANGEKFNQEDDLTQQDAQAEVARTSAKYHADKQEKKNAEHQKSVDANEKARAAEADVPDMKVQIVSAPKKAAPAAKRPVVKGKR